MCERDTCRAAAAVASAQQAIATGPIVVPAQVVEAPRHGGARGAHVQQFGLAAMPKQTAVQAVQRTTTPDPVVQARAPTNTVKGIFCHACGYQNTGRANFCKACGASTKPATTVAQPVAVVRNR